MTALVCCCSLEAETGVRLVLIGLGGGGGLAVLEKTAFVCFCSFKVLSSPPKLPTLPGTRLIRFDCGSNNLHSVGSSAREVNRGAQYFQMSLAKV